MIIYDFIPDVSVCPTGHLPSEQYPHVTTGPNVIKLFTSVINKICFYNELECLSMEQYALINVNNCLNTNIYSYLETSGGEIFYLYLDIVQFFNTSVN